MSEPAIRAADSKDAEFVAWTMQAAARSHLNRGWLDIALDRSEGECLEFLRRLALAETRSFCHHSLFLVAEVDGHPVSALCRYAAVGGDGYPLMVPAMNEVARSYGWGEAEISAMWKRLAYGSLCAMTASEDCWIIENVATLPRYRGRGLTGMLIKWALDDGRAHGSKEAQITFAIGNEPAERAYSKAGFSFTEERRHRDYEAACGSPGVRRFTRPL